MYLHLGQDTVVKTDEVVGVFDLDTATLGKKTRDFLAAAEKAGRVVNVSTELPKSFVVGAPERRRMPARQQTAESWPEPGPTGQDATVYIIQLGAATLKKRLDAGRRNVMGIT